jgi:hypothetical protein
MSRVERHKLKYNYLRAAEDGDMENFIDCVIRGIPLDSQDFQGRYCNTLRKSMWTLRYRQVRNHVDVR